MSGEMAFAYVMRHAPRDFFPINNRGDAAILYCFIFLYLAFAGGGPWSLDAILARRKTSFSQRKTNSTLRAAEQGCFHHSTTSWALPRAAGSFFVPMP